MKLWIYITFEIRQNGLGKDKLVASLGMKEASNYDRAGLLDAAMHAMFASVELQRAGATYYTTTQTYLQNR